MGFLTAGECQGIDRVEDMTEMTEVTTKDRLSMTEKIDLEVEVQVVTGNTKIRILIKGANN